MIQGTKSRNLYVLSLLQDYLISTGASICSGRERYAGFLELFSRKVQLSPEKAFLSTDGFQPCVVANVQ